MKKLVYEQVPNQGESAKFYTNGYANAYADSVPNKFWREVERFGDDEHIDEQWRLLQAAVRYGWYVRNIRVYELINPEWLDVTPNE